MGRIRPLLALLGLLGPLGVIAVGCTDGLSPTDAGLGQDGGSAEASADDPDSGDGDDAGTPPLEDAGPGNDAGALSPDAGLTSPTDGGPEPKADAGSVPIPDGGPPSDAGEEPWTPADAGLDAGTLGTDGGDAGPPPCWSIPGNNNWPPPGADVAAHTDTTTADTSGIVTEPNGDGSLWVVTNAPAMMHKWIPDDDGLYIDDAAWSSPRALRGVGGAGEPDAEGITRGPTAGSWAFVASERNLDDRTVSRLSVLRFDLSDTGNPLEAEREWDLTADVASIGIQVLPNDGFESITWLPDDVLTSAQLLDEDTGAPYNPAEYAAHHEGVFVLGVEDGGELLFYVLLEDGGAVRVGQVSSSLPQVMSLEADRVSGQLFAGCDDNCAGEIAVLGLTANEGPTPSSSFQLMGSLDRSSGLGNRNYEGIAFAPDPLEPTERAFFWVEDTPTPERALRRGSLPADAICAP